MLKVVVPRSELHGIPSWFSVGFSSHEALSLVIFLGFHSLTSSHLTNLSKLLPLISLSSNLLKLHCLICFPLNFPLKFLGKWACMTRWNSQNHTKSVIFSFRLFFCQCMQKQGLFSWLLLPSSSESTKQMLSWTSWQHRFGNHELFRIIIKRFKS